MTMVGPPQLDLTAFRALSAGVAPRTEAFVASAELPADRLRARLAVRGWVNPRDLIGDLARADAAGPLLDAVAEEVETCFAACPGAWFLAVATRRRLFATLSDDDLAEAAAERTPGDAADPIRAAVRMALDRRLPPLGELDDEHLGALASLCDWMGERWPFEIRAGSIADERASRALDADLRRMTAAELVGEGHREALSTLVAFTTGPRRATIGVTYLHGGGGAGKTTLLAHLHRELRGRNPPAPVVRLDFDDPAVDPGRPVTLNLALFGQLGRAVPDLAERSAELVGELRRVATTQRGSGHGPQHTKGAVYNLELESAVSESAADQASLSYGILSPAALGAPLTIVLDTAELVLAQSDRMATAIADWLHSLTREIGAEDLRIVIAGRDANTGPEVSALAASDLLGRLRAIGAELEPPIALRELNADEAAALLRSCGVEPGTARAAAAAVPGNPLLLRITAEALRSDDPGLVAAVRSAHQGESVDQRTAGLYLQRRIVAHLADPVARRYVLAALRAPIVTPGLVRHVIVPHVDKSDEPAAAAVAARVYAAIETAAWLARPALDRKSFAFHRETRKLALTLLCASPEDIAEGRAIHRKARDFHATRRAPVDRALAFYHAAMLGEAPPHVRDPAALREVLRDVLDELPAAARRTLGGGGAVREPAPRRDRMEPAGPAMHRPSDSDWRLYLEGDGERDGEGLALVRDDHAAEAPALYRARPTRPQGFPPTFVIQALTDLGEWWSDEVAVESILTEECERWFAGKRIAPADLSRIYWLTRLALLAGHGRLSEPHLAALAAASAMATGPGLSMFPGLLAVAEAAMRRPVMTDRMRSNAAKTDQFNRIMLIASHDEQLRTIRVPLGQLAVTQRDWFDRVADTRAGRAIAAHRWVQERLDALDGRPMAAVNALYGELRAHVPLAPLGDDRQARTLLFRGQTVELHRPLRQVLVELCGDRIAGPRTRALFDPTVALMSIRPAELHGERFRAMLAKNPQAWATAFVSYADRSRLLPGLCRTLAELPESDPASAKARRIAAAFLAWDAALCRGLGSQWHEEDVPSAPPADRRA